MRSIDRGSLNKKKGYLTAGTIGAGSVDAFSSRLFEDLGLRASALDMSRSKQLVLISCMILIELTMPSLGSEFLQAILSRRIRQNQ